MFHDGDLTSGISLAISQSKLVAVLITAPDDTQDEHADSYESRIWEEYWLQNLDHAWEELTGPPFGELIREKAIILRIELGSKEAQFLNAFCPVEQAPTFVIIREGKVLEKVEKGISREQFMRRVGKVVGLRQYQDDFNPNAGMGNVDRIPEIFGPADALDEDTELTSPSAQIPATAQSRSASVSQSPAPTTSPHPIQALPTPQPASQSSSQSQQQQIMEERRRRLEEDKERKDKEEKAQRIARAEARRKEAEEAAAMHGYGPDKGKKPENSKEIDDKEKARRDWLHQQKVRKEEAEKDRKRVLERIENDKKDRKLRAQAGKEESQAEPILRTSGAAATASSRTNHTGMCSIQVRLFDGSSIRTRFPPTYTLAKEVRAWIKETSPEGGADVPYTFRQILSPQPSRSIEISEEQQDLRELGLSPGATLVLVPVSGYTEAYSSGGGILGGAYNLVSGAVSSVTQYLPSLSRIYMGGTAEAQEASNVAGARMAGADSMGQTSADAQSGIRVKTLADQRGEQKDQRNEFYNGNSSAFEGRKDDDDR